MAKNNNKTILIILLAIIAIVFYQHSSLFVINLQSDQVQYNNHPIEIKFTHDLSNATISAYYNDIQLFESTEENGTIVLPANQTISYSSSVVNGSNVLKVENVKVEGIFKVVLKSGNITETQLVQIKNPFVDVKNDIPTTMNSGQSAKLTIQTYNPQGEVLEADSVDIDVYNPDGTKSTIFLDKSANQFTKTFNYVSGGEYIFKIHARKVGYETVESSVITNVLKSSGIHPIIFIWGSFIIIWIILFVIRRYRKK